MQIELNEKEIREIAKCLRMEVEIWNFKRGFSTKQTKEEKFTVQVLKKVCNMLNQIAQDKCS